MSERLEGGVKIASANKRWQFHIGPIWISRSDIHAGEKDRVGTGAIYMKRLLIEFGNRRRSIRFHHILRPDADLCLHDHPWWFLAYVLWGGYIEEVPIKQTEFTVVASWTRAVEEHHGFPRRQEVEVKPFRFHWRPLHYKHRITRLLGKSSFTIAIAGPIDQHWGFYTDHGKEEWEDFVNQPKDVRVGWCDTVLR